MSRHVKRGKAVRAKRRKTLTRRNAPKSGSWDRSLAAGKETNIRELARERDEALGQLAASSDVLQIISRSPGELEPVFTAMLNDAVRICEAKFGVLFLFEGDAWRAVALHGAAPPSFVEARQRHPVLPIVPGSALGRVTATKQVVQIADVQAEPAYRSSSAYMLGVETGDIRTVLSVPMLKAGALVGAFNLFRQEVRPFTDKQIELVQNFAAQAVIAIENTRLLKELRQRTDDLTELLEQQTATSEVLQVISSSPGELEPVFNALLANATRICEATFGNLILRDGPIFRFVAVHGPQTYTDFTLSNPVVDLRDNPGIPFDRLTKTNQVVHIPDLRTDQSYIEKNARIIKLADVAGARTFLNVPMLKERELIGVIALYREEVRPFTDKQVELVINFAAQAVIAIENTRLLNELRQSLEQQTATAEVLRVISSSPGELDPVFKEMLEKATQICGASFGTLLLFEGNAFRRVAAHNAPHEYVQFADREPFIRLDRARSLDRLTKTKEPVQIADMAEAEPNSPLTKLGGARTYFAVPMLKENELIGAIGIYRQEVRPFTENQIELVKNFAAQAVIAIENARLLNELRQSLEQQTATSEVLKVISSSPSDLRPVFQSMLENSVRICEAKFGQMFLCEGDKVRAVAQLDVPAALVQEDERRGAFQPSPEGGLMRAILTKHVIHIDDIMSEQPSLPVVKLGGARSYIAVPMLKESELLGVIVIYRQEVRPFTEKQIDLVQNFAAQAVIAIENARLLNDLNKLNQQLEQRVDDQVNEIERMGRLRRFLPPQVADLIVASGTEKQLESHRREITALFCDLRGFTGFSESSDPEDVMALLREYHAAIGGIINKFGGTLERYAGDGVMVVFNDPIPVDNPALQAVLMAIEMRAAIEGLIEKWRKLGQEIGFGIGIAHGFATLGTIGFEGRFDYAAIGTVSNVASRLCDEAKPGQILISPRVLMAVEKDITVEPVGDFALKGIRRPLTAYNVLTSKAAD